MKYVCMALISFYQRCLSALKPYPTCRFTPSCSAYAYEAFAKRGFFAGFVLMIWRILRCSPLSPCGFDPVPEKGFRTMPLRWSRYERPTPAPEDPPPQDGEPVPEEAPETEEDGTQKNPPDGEAAREEHSVLPPAPDGDGNGEKMEEQRSESEEPRP